MKPNRNESRGGKELNPLKAPCPECKAHKDGHRSDCKHYVKHDLDAFVNQKELNELADKLYKELRKRFGTCDEDKTSKINVFLIDRTRHWPFHFWQQPYDHKLENAKELDEALSTAVYNVQCATDMLKSVMMHRQYDKKPTVWTAEAIHNLLTGVWGFAPASDHCEKLAIALNG